MLPFCICCYCLDLFIQCFSFILHVSCYSSLWQQPISPLGSLKLHLIHYICKLHLSLSASAFINPPPPTTWKHLPSLNLLPSHPLYRLHLPPRLLQMCVSTILLIKKDVHPHTRTGQSDVAFKDQENITLSRSHLLLLHHTLNVLKSLAGLDITACRVQAGALGFQHDFIHTRCDLLRSRLLAITAGTLFRESNATEPQTSEKIQQKVEEAVGGRASHRDTSLYQRDYFKH